MHPPNLKAAQLKIQEEAGRGGVGGGGINPQSAQDGCQFALSRETEFV